MHGGNYTRIALASAAILGWCFGCQAGPARHRGFHRSEIVEPALSSGEVFISGHVRNAGRAAMPPDGRMTLGQAVIAAGGFTKPTDQLWVALRRGTGPLVHTTYLPSWMLERDLGADIPLASGDEISLVLHEETTLGAERARLVGSTANGEPFQILGTVARPGLRYIGQPVESLVRGPVRPVGLEAYRSPPVTRLIDVVSHAGPTAQTQVAVLKRRTISGVTFDYYVFPLYDQRAVVWTSDTLLVSGDEIIFGPLTSVPLLVSAFIEPLARQAVATAAEKPLDRKHLPFIEWKSGKGFYHTRGTSP